MVGVADFPALHVLADDHDGAAELGDDLGSCDRRPTTDSS
jgi:hypothetical protein